MWGCRRTLRYCISLLTLAFMSGVVILALLINLRATWWPVMQCVATAGDQHQPHLRRCSCPTRRTGPRGIADSHLTLPNDPVPKVRSIMYCPTLGFDLGLSPCWDGPPGLPRPPGAGGAGRVAIVRVGRGEKPGYMKSVALRGDT